MAEPDHHLPAIHDWHLRSVLAEFGLAQQIEAGTARCRHCHRQISWDNVGGLLALGANRFELVCELPDCLSDRQGNQR